MQKAAEFFGVEFLAQRRRTHEVAEHHGKLAAFARGCSCNWSVGWRDCLWCTVPQLGDCHQEPASIADGSNSESLEVFAGEIAQHVSPDGILAKRKIQPMEGRGRVAVGRRMLG